MNDETREGLIEVADLLRAASGRLVELAEHQPNHEPPEYGPGDAGTQRTEDRGRFVRSAKRELAELIRSIEGPNPRPAPRRPR